MTLTARPPRGEERKGGTTSKSITTGDGTRIHHEDRGSGQPIVLSHDWPLSADAWKPQLDFLASHGYRAVAHDRRGHGRSDRPPEGNDMDTYADDLARLIEELDLQDAVLVGHGTGGGEVARCVGRHGTARVAGVVLVGAVTPLMLKTEANPHGTPSEAFDGMRAGLANDRSGFFEDFAEEFYGANRPDADVSRGILGAFRSRAMVGSLKNQLGGIGAFSETDFTDDLKAFDVPTLIVHGDDDQIVPIVPSALRSAKLVKNSILKVYEGAPHGLTVTHKNRFNADLLEFIRRIGRARAARRGAERSERRRA